MPPESPQKPKAAELPENHPLRAKERALLQRKQSLDALDEREQSRLGHDLRAAKLRNENNLDAIRSAIAKEGK